MDEMNVDGTLKRKRLLLVNSTLHIGGAEQVAAFLAERIDDRQFETSACYLKAPGHVADQMVKAGVKLEPIPGLVSGRSSYLTSLQLRRLLIRHRVQIIHTHDIHGLIDGSVCRLVTPHLRHVHTFHFGNYPHRSGRYKVVERILWRVPDALVAVGHEQAAAIRACYGIPENRLRVIWNGVEDHSYPDDPEFDTGAPTGVPVIVSISTLIPQKGLQHLLEAAALLRRSGEPFILLIAGDGALKEELQRRCAELGLGDCVRMLGWVRQASRFVLPSCDIFVQSSLWEAMSVVVLEAMAAGKPMVVTRVGENGHVVLDDVTGLLVPPSDAQALADALRRLLRDPDLSARLAGAARDRYQRHFTVQHMVSRYQALYHEITNGRLTGTAAALSR